MGGNASVGASVQPGAGAAGDAREIKGAPKRVDLILPPCGSTSNGGLFKDWPVARINPGLIEVKLNGGIVSAQRISSEPILRRCAALGSLSDDCNFDLLGFSLHRFSSGTIGRGLDVVTGSDSWAREAQSIDARFAANHPLKRFGEVNTDFTAVKERDGSYTLAFVKSQITSKYFEDPVPHRPGTEVLGATEVKVNPNGCVRSYTKYSSEDLGQSLGRVDTIDAPADNDFRQRVGGALSEVGLKPDNLDRFHPRQFVITRDYASCEDLNAGITVGDRKSSGTLPANYNHYASQFMKCETPK